jgi:hypothetical protein
MIGALEITLGASGIVSLEVHTTRYPPCRLRPLTAVPAVAPPSRNAPPPAAFRSLAPSDFLISPENDLALFCAPPTGFIPVEVNVF